MRALRLTGWALATALAVSGCGLTDARDAALAEARVKPLDMADSLRPGLVGMPDYPATGWGNSAPAATTSATVQARLQQIGLQAAELGPALTVRTEPDGTSLGIPTLDFCAANYPSEALRSARDQRAAYDKHGSFAGISSEVVLYQSDAAAQQALHEVTAARIACPVDKPVKTFDGHTIVFAFHPAPGPSNTPLLPADARLIIHTTMKVDGQPQTAFLVYQVQGRVLAALYAVDTTGKPMAQSALDPLYGLAGDMANRLRTIAPTF